jgi:hypothetical protein
MIVYMQTELSIIGSYTAVKDRGFDASHFIRI